MNVGSNGKELANELEVHIIESQCTSCVMLLWKERTWYKRSNRNIQKQLNITMPVFLSALITHKVMDLGVWASLQTTIERMYFMRRGTIRALENSLISTWVSKDMDRVLTQSI